MALQNWLLWRFSGCGTKIGWEDCWRKRANRKNKQCKNQEANRQIADRIKKSKFFSWIGNTRIHNRDLYLSPAVSQRANGETDSRFFGIEEAFRFNFMDYEVPDRISLRHAKRGLQRPVSQFWSESRVTLIPASLSTLKASDWLKPFSSRQRFRLTITGKNCFGASFCGINVRSCPTRVDFATLSSMTGEDLNGSCQWWGFCSGS